MLPAGDIQPARKRSWFARVLLITATTLAGASFWTLSEIVERQRALTAYASVENVWPVYMAALETARLRVALDDWAMLGGEERRELAEVWAGIVAARARSLPQAEIRRRLRQLEGGLVLLTQLGAAVRAARPDETAPFDPEAAAALRRELGILLPRLAQLAAASQQLSAGETTSNTEAVLELHRQLIALLVLLLAVSAGGAALLLRQNRALRAARAELDAALGRLSLQNSRFDAALSNMSQALGMFGPDRRLVVTNPRFAQLFGLAPEALRPGMSVQEVASAVRAAGRFDAALLDALWAAEAALGAAGRADSFFREAPGGAAIAVAHQPMAAGGWVSTWEDITERRRAETRVAHLALHDQLTGLANRTQFGDRLAAALEEAPPGIGAVLLVDLDRFKDINDTLGHAAGDELLRVVAGRLVDTVGPAGLVARMGGDEFAVLLPPGGEGPEAVAERIVERLRAPYALPAFRARIGASVGVAPVAANAPQEAGALLRQADLALYAAKEAGRNGWRPFVPRLAEQAEERRTLEEDLRGALADGQFALAYQPVLDLASERVVGFEALLRWRHPRRGAVSPAVFVPVLEETGLIEPVGLWALDTACATAAAWPASVRIAVNLSPLQFRAEDLSAQILRVLDRRGFDPARLELEVTESALLREAAAEALHTLRGAGVRTALDDFGTGFSSLSYLLRFPFDKLKIDRSFVRDAAARPDGRAILESLAHLAARLDMVSTAEGIETAEDLAAVRAAGCTQGQGYLFAKPLPAEEARRLVAAE